MFIKACDAISMLDFDTMDCNAWQGSPTPSHRIDPRRCPLESLRFLRLLHQWGSSRFYAPTIATAVNFFRDTKVNRLQA